MPIGKMSAALLHIKSSMNKEYLQWVQSLVQHAPTLTV